MVTEEVVFENLAFRLTHKLVSHPLFNQYFNSLDDFKDLTGFEAHELDDLFALGDNKLQAHFELIGKRLFQDFHPPFIDISQFLDFAANELITLINKHDLEYSTGKISSLHRLILNSIAKSYFYLTLDDIAQLASQSCEDEYSPLSIHFLWLQKVTSYLNGTLAEPPERDHLSCDFAHWLDSMESEMLLFSAGKERIESHAKLFLAHRMTHQQLTYVISFVKENDFALAFSHLEILYQSVLELDQQIRSLQLVYMEQEEYNFYDFIDQKSDEVDGLYYFISIRIHRLQSQVSSVRKQLFHEVQNIKNDLHGLLTAAKMDGVSLLYDSQITVFFQRQSLLKDSAVESFMQDDLHPYIQSLAAKGGYSTSSIGVKMDAINPYREYRVPILRELEHFRLEPGFTYFSDKDAEKLYLNTVESRQIAQLAQKALDEDRLEVFYQPIVQKDKQPKQYVEALVRAPSEEGYLAADKFIHFLESENKMKELDLLVIRRINQAIPELSQVVDKLSINIYPTSFSELEIIDAIIELNKALKKSGINLIVEITEYLFMHDITSIELLATEHGISFAMDDFGSGYSNLLQLIEYSERGILEILKVDGSIVSKIDTNETVFKVLQSIIQIAKILDMTPVVMEYVYNKEIHKKLESLDIPLNYQGFYFAEPLSLDDLKTRYC